MTAGSCISRAVYAVVAFLFIFFVCFFILQNEWRSDCQAHWHGYSTNYLRVRSSSLVVANNNWFAPTLSPYLSLVLWSFIGSQWTTKVHTHTQLSDIVKQLSIWNPWWNSNLNSFSCVPVIWIMRCNLRKGYLCRKIVFRDHHFIV